jgi:cell division protein FtsQ
MLNSIINQNIATKQNIDRVTSKKNHLYYCKNILITLIILSFFIISLSQINYNKKIKTFNQFLINNGFAIKNIQILGIKNISKDTIIQIVNAENKSNIFNVNLSKIYNNLSDNDWVRDLNVERILPNTIKIKILEKKPIGIWQNQISNKLITENGEIISTANLNKFKNNLPIIHGDHANKNANSILNILRKNQLFAKNIWSLTYINNRRWNLHFKQGIIVLLPSKGILKAWNKIIKLQEQYDVLNLGLTELDFRNPSKILGRINFDKNLIKRRKNL